MTKTKKKLSECVGEIVNWMSSGTDKSGIILAVNLAGDAISEDPIFMDLGVSWQQTRISQDLSVNDRFLIVVERVGRNNIYLKPHYYCATVSVVAKAMGWELVDDRQIDQ
jgi:hypothetical protein